MEAIRALYPTYEAETAMLDANLEQTLRTLTEARYADRQRGHAAFMSQFKDAIQSSRSQEAAIVAVRSYEKLHRKETARLRAETLTGDRKAVAKLKQVDATFKSAAAKNASDLVSLQEFLAIKGRVMYQLVTLKQQCCAQEIAEDRRIRRDILRQFV